MKALYWRLFIIRLALRWIAQFNIGDEVIWRGQRWRLSQGVSNPYWNLARDGGYAEHVHRSEFRKPRTPRAAWRSFRSGYRFYMQNWYAIWRREGITPWMRGCRIWAGRPPR